LIGNSGTHGWRPRASRFVPLDLARIHQYALRPIGAPRSLSAVPVRTPSADQSSRVPAMSYFNRRKHALIGFLLWWLLKREIRRRTPSVGVPGLARSSGGGKGRWLVAGAIGVALGALVGGLLWTRRRSAEVPSGESADLGWDGRPAAEAPLDYQSSTETAETPVE
jgi:hypothetical protein